MRRGSPQCPGCERGINCDRLCCAVCEARLPAAVRSAVTRTYAEHAKAQEAARQWLREHPSATERDIEILLLVAHGLDDAAIADRVRLSVHTVKDHLRRMSRRWGCRGRAHLVATGFRLGYIETRNGVIR